MSPTPFAGRRRAQITSPVYIRLSADPLQQTPVSVREHRSARANQDPDAPLLVVTLLPGFLTGSYGDRDYFELLSPLLFEQFSHCRLRVFTVNHPGYDLPAGQRVNHLDLRPYSIHRQPTAMHAAYTWIFDHLLADEPEIHWLAYGHSMGGLALSRYVPDGLVQHLAQQGRHLDITRVLSAPAFCLLPQALAALDQLETLQSLKRRFGRWPLYVPLATALYRSFAPLFYRREAERFSITALAEFGDFRVVNPFVLLAQGRELLRLSPHTVGGCRLLDGAHLILAEQDGMVDFEAMLALADEAQAARCDVQVHTIENTHLLERDAPEEVVAILRTLLAERMAGCRSAPYAR